MVIPSDETYRPIRSSASPTLEADPVAVYFEEAIDLYHNLFDRSFHEWAMARMPVLGARRS